MSRTYKIFYNEINKYFSFKFKIRRFGTKQLQLQYEDLPFMNFFILKNILLVAL